ncbi:MAG: sigma-70 family RNA polymerase sigma factor, partial [Firmicutes bacterium]|nr:sigma-70 family RNA polymerase sigma factor [Bacillota bacterium]
MARLSLHRRQKPGDDRLTALLTSAKSGNRDAREALLESYLPFVDRVAAGVCGRAIGRTDDEFQIALVAMNEAIDAYDGGRGSFIAFAETVMRRRLIDSFRSNARARDVPMTAYDDEDDEGNV